MLFENAKRDSNLTLFKILRAFKEMHKEVAQKSNAIRSSPVFGKDLAWRFFYGACQGKEGRYGGGMALFLGEKHYFHLQLRASVGTNTRVELLALWGLLFFARSKGILSLQVVEDSKVIINWFLRLNELSFVVLERWQRKIGELQEYFIDLRAQHIYKSFNVLVDGLLNDALQLVDGLLLVREFVDDALWSCDKVVIF